MKTLFTIAALALATVSTNATNAFRAEKEMVVFNINGTNSKHISPMLKVEKEPVTVTFNLEKGGALNDSLEKYDRNSIEVIIITGKINGTDIAHLTDLSRSFYGYGDHGSLRKIDLSGANIVSGGSSYIRDEDGNEIYSSNDTIGERMFYECVRLNEVVLPTVAKYIGKSAFESCRALKSVTIPENVKGIGEFAFYYCDSINNVVLSEGIEEIPRSAFSRCKCLTSFVIPSTVKKIGRMAFFGASALEEINMPEGVEEIAYGAFSACNSATKITIPSTVTKIYDLAFSNCTAVKTISSYITNPTGVAQGDNVFTNVDYKNCVLMVPGGTKKLYQEATAFSNFMTITEMTTGINDKTTAGNVTEIARYSLSGNLLTAPAKGVNIVKYSDGKTVKVVVR